MGVKCNAPSFFCVPVRHCLGSIFFSTCDLRSRLPDRHQPQMLSRVIASTSVPGVRRMSTGGVPHLLPDGRTSLRQGIAAVRHKPGMWASTRTNTAVYPLFACLVGAIVLVGGVGGRYLLHSPDVRCVRSFLVHRLCLSDPRSPAGQR